MANEVFRTDLQKLLDAKANSSAVTPSTRKINGKALSSDIILKAADFDESVTGTKMVMSIVYRVVREI